MTLLGPKSDGAASPRPGHRVGSDTSSIATASSNANTENREKTRSIGGDGTPRVPNPLIPKQKKLTTPRTKLQSYTPPIAVSATPDGGVCVPAQLASPRPAHSVRLHSSVCVQPGSPVSVGRDIRCQGSVAVRPGSSDKGSFRAKPAPPKTVPFLHVGSGSVNVRAASPQTTPRVTRGPLCVSPRPTSPQRTTHVHQAVSRSCTPVRCVSPLRSQGPPVTHVTARFTPPPRLNFGCRDVTPHSPSQPSRTIRQTVTLVRHGSPLPQFGSVHRQAIVAAPAHPATVVYQTADSNAASSSCRDEVESPRLASWRYSANPEFIVPPSGSATTPTVLTPPIPPPPRWVQSDSSWSPASRSCTPPARVPHTNLPHKRAGTGAADDDDFHGSESQNCEAVGDSKDSPQEMQRVAALEVLCQGLRQSLVKKEKANRELQSKALQIAASLEEREREVRDLGEQLAKQIVACQVDLWDARSDRLPITEETGNEGYRTHADDGTISSTTVGRISNP